MPVNGPREKLAADLELLKPVAGHVAYWSCGLIAGQSLTLGDLRALLAEPTPAPMSDIGMAISDALRQVGAALREVVALMRQSDGVIGFHLNGEVLAWSEFDLEDKIADALALLPALAQQMEEGERFARQLVKQSEMDRESTEAKLAKTCEALAVAEGALRRAQQMIAAHQFECLADPTLTDGRFLYIERQAREALARIAALSPTGTPGAEGGPK